MPRKFLRRYVPSVEKVRQVKALRIFGSALFHPALWHLNRRSAAGGVALGLFCGLIPGPFQMLGAGIAAIYLRVNLPVALLTTLYTNPLTIVPLYLAAFQLGSWTLGVRGRPSAPPPEWLWSDMGASLTAYGHWVVTLGAPLALGLLLLALLLAGLGYLAVRLIWNLYLRRAWLHRQQRYARRAHATAFNAPAASARPATATRDRNDPPTQGRA